MDKKEYQEAINEFIEYTEKEMDQWIIYQNSPEIQKEVRKCIIKGVIQLPDSNLQRSLIITKLIEKNIFTPSEIDEAFKIPIEKRKWFTLDDLDEAHLEPEPMLVNRGLIPTEGYGLIGGIAKEGKTCFALQLALSLISGQHFLEEFKVLKKCRVIYVGGENNVWSLTEIKNKQTEGLKNTVNTTREDRKNLYYFDGKGITIDGKLPKIPELKEIINRTQPQVIVLDPLGLYVGFDINKADSIKRLKDIMRETCNCYWLLVHHYRKPQGIKSGQEDIQPMYKLLGSSYLAGFAETIISLEREGENFPNNYKKLYITSRRAPEPEPIHLRRDITNLFYEAIESTELKQGKVSSNDVLRILEKSFKGKASFTDLVSLCSQEFKVKGARIANLLTELKESGIIAKETGKKGNWYIKKIYENLVMV